MKPKKTKLWLLITVASLGYFVDIYDLILYNVIKKESLDALGIPMSKETLLFSFQMAGMLIGGFLWGIWGDKRGRVSVLFGSIILYSIANMANAFVGSFEAYAFWRFVAGLGLAGELGAAITLVSENMHKDKRGYGTMIIVTFGALGAVAAYFIARKGGEMAWFFEMIFRQKLANWQISYIVGSFLGFFLLILRSGTFESGMFKQVKESNVVKGSFKMLFKTKQTFLKYLACICIGIPVWYVVGVLIALSHKLISNVNGEPMDAGFTGELVMWSYIGLSVGDFASGLISQILKSRKKVIFMYLGSVTIMSSIFFLNNEASPEFFKVLGFLLGAATGYWALFVTNASEQFGTNIRSTVTATVPNFVRGSVVLIYFLFDAITPLDIGPNGAITAAAIVGVLSLGAAFWGTYYIDESFSKDLDYVEV